MFAKIFNTNTHGQILVVCDPECNAAGGMPAVSVMFQPDGILADIPVNAMCAAYIVPTSGDRMAAARALFEGMTDEKAIAAVDRLIEEGAMHIILDPLDIA